MLGQNLCGTKKPSKYQIRVYVSKKKVIPLFFINRTLLRLCFETISILGFAQLGPTSILDSSLYVGHKVMAFMF